MTKLKEFLRSLGPGFIIASVVLGPGSITVASRIGSEQGYSFLWVIALAALFMITFTSMSVRFGVVNPQTMLQRISENYGKWFAVLIGISTFLSASSFQFGNNIGIGIGMQGITGIDERIWPLVFTPLAILLIFFAKNLYRTLEKIMMILVMVMIAAFFINLVMVKPEIGQIANGFIPSGAEMKNLDMISALIATTFTLNGAIYQSYLAQNKGWKIKQLKRGLQDTYMGIGFLALISMVIIITAASALYPLGIKVNSAADMAFQMESLFGGYAKVIFSIGLCAAAFSSLTVNAVIGGGLMADGFGLGSTMDSKFPKIFTTFILILGMIIAVFFKGNVIYALILAQASSVIAVPLIAAGMFLILNNKKVMGQFRNNLWQNLLAISGFVVICLMVYFMMDKLIHYLLTL